ncbi:HET-domain-containing protein, partial [Periconia macrospinosa]
MCNHFAEQLPSFTRPDDDIERIKIWYEQYRSCDPALEGCKELADAESDQLDMGLVEHLIQQQMITTHVYDGFCDDCHDLFRNWHFNMTHKRLSIHTFSTYMLEAAYRKGCKSCAFLLFRLMRGKLLDTFRKIENRMIYLSTDLNPETHLYLEDSAPLNAWDMITSYPGNEYGAFKDHREYVQKWLGTCTQYHAKCNEIAAKDRATYPTRLVSIRGNKIRLVLTADWTVFPPYSTLSYSWGGASFLKLTSDNFKTFVSQIQYEDLPKTFQDAVQLSRDVGFEYIWIDALCIIQAEPGEEPLDFRKEAGRMRHVYGGSALNIAASTGRTPCDGFVSPPENFNAGFYARVTDGTVCRVLAFYSSYDYDEATRYANLGSRAWCFQERLLAPRTVQVGEQGLYWECRSSFISEFLPTIDGVGMLSTGHLLRHSRVGMRWGVIVEAYSGTVLTNNHDKLPALSGIANRYHELTGDNYLAGLWRKNLVDQLGWRVWEKSKRSDRRIPSWSWASVNTHPHMLWQTSFYSPDDRHAEVVDASTTLIGPDPYGEVSGGVIRLRCTAIVSG